MVSPAWPERTSPPPDGEHGSDGRSFPPSSSLEQSLSPSVDARDERGAPAGLADQMANERILLVEGDVLLRLELSNSLREAGFVVIEASSADDAWIYLEAEGAVDLVLCESAPRGALDGATLARRIAERFIALPVLLTAEKDRAPPEGEWPFITKPYAIERVKAAIFKALGPNKPKDEP